MQAQDAPTVFIFKLWPWIEANRKQFIIGAIAILATVLVFSFVSYHHEQGEITAGQALSQALVSQPHTSTPDEIASALLKVAAQYPGTAAAERAQLQGATMLFEAGKYADAQTQFQKFVDANPASHFKALATFGVATSLEAQGQKDAALALYQRVIGYSDTSLLLPAKFAVARLSEQAGKLNDALTDYEEVARAGANTQFGEEAGLRAMEIKNKLATNKPAVSVPGISNVTFKP